MWSARSILGIAGIVVAVTFVGAVATVQAASNLNSSKSNVYKPVTTNADKAACASVGAAIVMRGSQQVCVNPTLPAGWSEKQLPSCETCNRLCPGVCFMHVEGGCICFYDPLRSGG
jgi:hypothetical protein